MLPDRPRLEKSLRVFWGVPAKLCCKLLLESPLIVPVLLGKCLGFHFPSKLVIFTVNTEIH